MLLGYSGTIYCSVLGNNVEDNEDGLDGMIEVINTEFATEYNATALDPSAFNNTYAFAMKKA